MVEFTHMVMGPTCGMLFADLGAEVIKVEPPKLGEHSAELLSSLGYSTEQAGRLAALHVDAAVPPSI